MRNISNWILLILALCPAFLLNAQGVRVPSDMRFGEIKLRINENARREIQEDVDAITQSPKYLDQKVQRALLYFPIIERILAEERVPDDIKYLVIQESALIPDAVSSSNAVGYWQFKDFTAIEMGLRVDGHIDERMNISSATRAAAKYFKKNNFYFNNWLNALQAYQMGAGAAMKVIDEKERGARSMTITRKTYWYVKKYLAHKVAYEYALSKAAPSDQKLLEYRRGGSKTLRQIASEFLIDEAVLESYNKWLKRGKIPMDKEYSVIIPVDADDDPTFVSVSTSEEETEELSGTTTSESYDGIEDPGRFPEISESKKLTNRMESLVYINGILGIIGKEGQTLEELAEMMQITETRFRTYNEILPHESIVNGQVYYFKKKKNKAKVHYHTLQYDETMWSISQKYGVKMSKLIKKNRLNDENDIEPGMVLWLRYVRPASVPVAYREVEKIIVSESPQTDDEHTEGENMDFVEPASDNGPEIKAAEPDVEIEENSGIEITDDQGEQIEEKIKILHKVQAKETLYAISKIYNVEVMDIVDWNDLNITDGLSIDQVLDIWVLPDWQENLSTEDSSPGEDTEAEDTGFMEYRVQPGDTLYAIANKFDITVEEIKRWNNKTDNSISIGEKIRIKR